LETVKGANEKEDGQEIERKINLIWMKEAKEKYRIKINIDNKAAVKTDKKFKKNN
jgi:hypothetical protein